MMKCTIYQHCGIKIPAVAYDCPSDFNPKEIPFPQPQALSMFTKHDGDYVPIVPIVEAPFGWTKIPEVIISGGITDVQVMVQPSGPVHIKFGDLEIVIALHMTDAELARLCIERAK